MSKPPPPSASGPRLPSTSSKVFATSSRSRDGLFFTSGGSGSRNGNGNGVNANAAAAAAVRPAPTFLQPSAHPSSRLSIESHVSDNISSVPNQNRPQSASSLSRASSAPRRCDLVDLTAEEDTVVAANNRCLELSTSQEREQAYIDVLPYTTSLTIASQVPVHNRHTSPTDTGMFSVFSESDHETHRVLSSSRRLDVFKCIVPDAECVEKNIDITTDKNTSFLLSSLNANSLHPQIPVVEEGRKKIASVEKKGLIDHTSTVHPKSRRVKHQVDRYGFDGSYNDLMFENACALSMSEQNDVLVSSNIMPCSLVSIDLV